MVYDQPMTLSGRAPLLALLLLAACGPATPEPTPPPASTVAASTPAATDEAVGRRAADTALASLSRRKFIVTGCSSADVRAVAEADASTVPAVSERCTLLVAHRADGTWIVVVRSPSQPGNVWAVVNVSAAGDGVQHIDYKP
jgi:hypothetical protein